MQWHTITAQIKSIIHREHVGSPTEYSFEASIWNRLLNILLSLSSYLSRLFSLHFLLHREDCVITAWKDTFWMSNAERKTDSVRRMWQVTNQLAEKVLSPLLLLLLLLFPPYLTSVQLPLIRAFTDGGIKMAPEPRQLMRRHRQGRSFMHNSVCQNLSFIFCLDSQSLFNTLSAFTPVDRL